MPDFLLKNIRMGLSNKVETVFNEQPASTSFHRLVTSARQFYVPVAEKFDDRGKVGLGTDLPNIRETGYLNPVSMEISDTFDSHIHAMILARGCGGTVVDAAMIAPDDLPVAGYTHSVKVAPTVTQLPSSVMVWGVGGADYYFYGMTVESFQIQGSRADQPTFSATLVGTGKNGAVATVGVPIMLAYLSPQYVKGAETQIFYTNGSLKQLADRASNTQRILGWSVGLNNNNITDDKRPGDKRIISTSPTSGHYVDRMLSGDREITGDVTVTVDTAMQEVADGLSDTIYTDFTIGTNGKYINPTETGGQQFGTDFIFHSTYVSAEEAVDDNGLAAIKFSLFPVFSTTPNTSMSVVINNTLATLV